MVKESISKVYTILIITQPRAIKLLKLLKLIGKSEKVASLFEASNGH